MGAFCFPARQLISWGGSFHFTPARPLPAGSRVTLFAPGMTKKVILFGPLPPPYGGVSVYLSTLAELWKGSGVRVWATHEGGRKSVAAHVRHVNHRRLGVIPALLREGRGGGVRVLDATHFHLEYPHPILLPLWLAAKLLLRFEWYKNIHDGSLPARHRHFNFVRRWLFRRAANSVTEFVVVSEDLRRWLRDEIKVRQHITLVPGLLPLPPAASNHVLPAATQAALAPYLRRRRRVCCIGVFIPSYGFRHVADAVARIRAETNLDIGLLLLDGVFARADDYRAEVLRDRDWITVLENVPHPEVSEIMNSSDAFVRAFGHESYGISRVEAIWCGLPVVATTAGETRGMLTYEFGDENELVRQLKRALFDPPAQDVAGWAAQFQQEAEANLQALRKTLDLT